MFLRRLFGFENGTPDGVRSQESIEETSNKIFDLFPEPGRVNLYVNYRKDKDEYQILYLHPSEFDPDHRISVTKNISYDKVSDMEPLQLEGLFIKLIEGAIDKDRKDHPCHTK